MLRELARKSVAEIARRGKCEVLGDYAFMLPVARFCTQLGLPPSEQATFLRIGNELIYGTVRVRNERGAEAAAEHRADYGCQIDTIMAELIRDRKANPGDDIVTALLDVRRNGESLADEDILNVVTFLFHAGTDSTATAIGFAMLHLAQSPFDRDLLYQQPNLWPSAVEELLRIGAVHHLGRVARSDVEIEGQLIRAGEMIMVPTAAANRDPAAFPAPDDVDLARSPNRHLTFGVGPHRCLGAAQARLEVTVALQEFHNVVRDYELDSSVPISYLSSGGKSRPDAVHLRFTPVTLSTSLRAGRAPWAARIRSVVDTASADATTGRNRFTGRVAVVTGSGKGIGEAEATLLAREGASVVISDVGFDNGVSRADNVVDKLRGDGLTAVAFKGDVGSFEGARSLIDLATSTFGRLDILVNNAGLRAAGPIADYDEEAYNSVLDSHLRATFATIKYAAPWFVKQGSGVIVNTGSESGIGHAYNCAYSAAKEGIAGLTRSVARELGIHNIRCNQVRPNAQETTKAESFVRAMRDAKPHFDQLGQYWLGNRGNLRRLSHPEDVAVLVAWLCSDAASHLNGQDFLVMGPEYGLWTDPEISRSAIMPGGWSLDALDEWAPQLLVYGLSNRFAGDASAVTNQAG